DRREEGSEEERLTEVAVAQGLEAAAAVGQAPRPVSGQPQRAVAFDEVVEFRGQGGPGRGRDRRQGAVARQADLGVTHEEIDKRRRGEQLVLDERAVIASQAGPAEAV